MGFPGLTLTRIGVASVAQLHVLVFIDQKLENSWRLFGMNLLNLPDLLSQLNSHSHIGN